VIAAVIAAASCAPVPTVGTGAWAPPLAVEVSPDEFDAAAGVELAPPPSAGAVPEPVVGAAVRTMACDTGRSAAGCGFAAALPAAAAAAAASVVFPAEAAGRA
jgi:hypothetical protein